LVDQTDQGAVAMITLTREEAQELLNALTYVGDAKDIYSDTIDMLRARLAQPEPEPVAWIKKDRSSIEVSIMSAEYMRNAGFEPLYTAPPQREWQGLTDEEIRNEAKNHVFDESFFSGAIWARGQIMRKNNG